MKNLLILCLSLISLSSYSTGLAQDATSPEDSMADFCKKYPRDAYSSLTRIPHASQWFEIYKVAPGVTAIYEPHQWQEAIFYLIEGESTALLFDTGNGIGNLAPVVNSLTDKPVTVLNSHSHYDHVGGNYSFDNILGMDTAFTVGRQQGIPNSEIAIEVSSGALCRQPPEGVNESTHVGRPYKITKTIQDGHQIDLGSRVLEVIHIPGHTPDAIALIDREAGLLWTGDSFYAGPIWLYAPETDLTAYRQSLQRLIVELPNINALLPAHNTPWVEPSVLPEVLAKFDAMLRGQGTRISGGDGTVEYRFQNEDRFSFLLRDEPLPYKQ